MLIKLMKAGHHVCPAFCFPGKYDDPSEIHCIEIRIRFVISGTSSN